jgi:uncharacterized protein YbaP (TraB family)
VSIKTVGSLALLDRWIDIRMLRELLDDPQSSAARLRRSVTAYRAGDDTALLGALLDPADWTAAGRTEVEMSQFIDEIFYLRNEQWIAPIESALADGDAFVAVGVGQLIGRRGVIDLLAARGHRVTRVSPRSRAPSRRRAGDRARRALSACAAACPRPPGRRAFAV